MCVLSTVFSASEKCQQAGLDGTARQQPAAAILQVFEEDYASKLVAALRGHASQSVDMLVTWSCIYN